MAKVQIICIYLIKNPNGRIYIGQSWDLNKRYKSGVSSSQRQLYRSYQKHGKENHTKQIIHQFIGEITQHDLDYWERHYIDLYKAEGFELLNIREGGGNNGKLAIETKVAIGAKSKSYHENNPEWSKRNIQRIIDANKGTKRTDATKKAISEALKNHERTADHNASISLSKKGKPSPHKGKHFSPEAVERIRTGIKTRNQKKCPIVQYTMEGEFIKEWPSIKDASETLSIHKGTIGGCIRNVPHYKSAGGFTWRYK